MSNRIFDPENVLFRGIGKALDVMVLSVLWVIFCLPVVTLGPASTALYYSVVKCLRRGERAPYINFFRCFRSNFKTGALAGIILTAGAVLLWLEHNLLVRMAGTGSQGAVVLYYAFCVVASLLFGAACYVFPVLSRFTCNLGTLFAQSGQLALRHLPTTLLLAVINLAALWVYASFWLLLLPLLFVPALAAFLSSLPLERVFRKYTQQAEGQEEEDPDNRPWYLR